MKYRLNEYHPLYQKVMRIYDLCEELKLQINVNSGLMTIRDTTTGLEVCVEDIEKTYHFSNSFTIFPPPTEFKLTYEEEETD